jgi:hypothetical protein
MRRAALLLALMLAIPSGQAQRAAVAPWMTGERLLQRLAPTDPSNVILSPHSVLPTKPLVAEHHSMMNREFVQGYITAIHDATEGKAWCYNEHYKSPKPDTFWDESRWGLHRLSPVELKRNAADLLVEIWREKWPCPAEQRRQK